MGVRSFASVQVVMSCNDLMLRVRRLNNVSSSDRSLLIAPPPTQQTRLIIMIITHVVCIELLKKSKKLYLP